MVKYLLILLVLLVVGTSTSYAIYEEGQTPTTADSDEVMTMTATDTTVTPTKSPVREAVGARKQAVTTAKETMKDSMMQAREEFKEKMAEIKDQRKVNRLTNLDNKITEINKRRTTQMDERLEKLTGILSRISTKAAALKANGVTTTTVDANIKAAETALQAAQTAVDTQAAKDYVVEITTETALKSAASTTIQEFITDMKATHKTVTDANSAVRKAHVSLVQLNGAKTTVTPSVTVTVTP